MKTLIYFNSPDTPQNMGQSQLTENIELFLLEHIDKLPNADITGNILTFDTFGENGEIAIGYAVIMEVPNDFKN